VAPSPNPTAAKPKAKQPRKSAPAALALQDTVRGVAEVHATPMRQGDATALASSPLPDTLPAKSGNTPIFDSDRSISVGVKTRKRKQTVSWRMVRGVETRVSISDMDVPETRKPEATSVLYSPTTPSLPYTPAILRPSVPKSRRLPPPTPTTPQQPLEYHDQRSVPHSQPNHIPHPQNYTSHPQNHFHHPPPISNPSTPALDAIDAGFRETDRLIAQLSRPTTPVPLRLAPLKTLPQTQQQHHLQHEAMNRHHEHRPSMQEQRQPKLAPLEPKFFSPGPRNGISSNVGSPVSLRPGSSNNAFFFTDPLVGQLGYPPLWLREEWGEREQYSPQREGQQQVEGHWPHGQHRGQQQQQGHSPHPGSGPMNRQDSWRGFGPPQQQQPQQGYQGTSYAQQSRTGKDGWRITTGRDSEGSKMQLQGGQQVERTSAPVSPWCPDEQLRKEQEAALMLSAMSGRTGYYQG
jgi:NAD-dependent histone deacetylase SIR2